MKKLKVEEMGRLTLEEYKEVSKMPLIVVLDNVRSMHNVGSILRTADAFRVECVCLCGITSVPPSPEIHKTALGAEESVDWRYFKTTMEALDYCRSRGYMLMAAEQVEGSLKLGDEIPAAKGYAVVMGHEVEGVAQEVADACDCAIEIPQYGTKHSLNVSVAAGIVMWTLFKKLASREIQ